MDRIDEIYLNNGINLFVLKRYEEAIQFFNKAIELNPNYFRAILFKGLTLAKSNRHLEAIQCYEKAIEIKQDDSIVYYNKGRSLCNLKDIFCFLHRENCV